MAKSISIEAYKKHIASGRALAQWARIYRYLLCRAGAYTRSEISEHLHIRLSSVCGRVNELMSAGLITEKDRRNCSVTKEPAHSVTINREKLNDSNRQPDLFRT